MDVIDAEGGKRFLNGKLRGGFIASGLLLVPPTSYLLRGKALSSLTYRRPVQPCMRKSEEYILTRKVRQVPSLPMKWRRGCSECI